MKIIVDSREQDILDFPFKQVSEIVVQKLDVGDYACEVDGKLLPIIFERKSKGDLFGTLGKGNKRFRKELQRAIDSDVKLVLIVECSLVSVLSGYTYKSKGRKRTSKLKGSSVLKTMFTLWVKYGLFPVFCSRS